MITETVALIGAAKSMWELMEKLKTTLPKGKDQADKLKQLIDQIEKTQEAAQLTEVSAAKELGYEICYCDYPPQRMVSDESISPDNIKYVKCQKCGKTCRDPHEKAEPSIRHT